MQNFTRTIAFFGAIGAAGMLAGNRAQADETLAAVETVAQAPAQVPSICGDWSGTWTSCTTGHQGPLKARISQIDSCHYEVRFTGRFCKVIPFRYKTVLTVSGTEDGRIRLQGSERLGVLLGTFSMNGSATSSSFVSNYQSKDDHGQFRLQRSN